MDTPIDAPEHCPGTKSEDAGKASACAGCPNQTICASGEANKPDPDIDIIHEKLSAIKNKIIILSGKGGVGKSTATAMIARSLARKEDQEVGILDVDTCGPSQPRITGSLGEEVHPSGSGWSPVFISENLCVVSMGFLLSSPEDAVILRGPKKNGIIKQFLKDVNWGSLDYLVIDTPPGTKDEHLTLAQYVASCENTAAVIVTTPQEVALLDVRKQIDFCRQVKIPIIGIIENMSLFVCPNCKTETAIFPATTGGAQGVCDRYHIPLLGKISIDPSIAQTGDSGENLWDKHPDSPTCKEYNQISQRFMENFRECQLPSQDFVYYEFVYIKL